MVAASGRYDEVVLLACNIDDMTGEALGFAMDALFAVGALDVWFTPIQMKKNRPGVTLSALVRPNDADAVRRWLLANTSTLGVRWTTMQREIAERESCAVATRWGEVRCKVKSLEGRVVSVKPEYDDCARLARAHDVPVTFVMEEARAAGIKAAMH
jgi:hypothetical protein